jgi:very-short-patch-repair endonuclease
MRADPTDAERKLWYLLRDRRLGHIKWRRQHVIDDRYIVDFVSFEHRLIIEADGSQHADNRTDIVRDAYLASQGLTVLRFWNSDVLTNLEGVAVSILEAVKSSGAQLRGIPLPCPLPQGERGSSGADINA